MKTNSKIFIPGASGMVGSAIVRKLISEGYCNLVGSYHSRLPAPAMFGQKGDTPPEGLRLERLDLTDQQAAQRFFELEKPDFVFLAAAKVGGIGGNSAFPADFIFQNLAIQTNVIHAAWRYGVRKLLFLGSSCIYPKNCPQPIREEYLLTGPLEPTNDAYAVAKIAGIKMCQAFNQQYGTCFISAMPTNLYGPNDNYDLKNSHVLPAMIRKFHLAKLASQDDWAGIQKDEKRHGRIPADVMAAISPPPSALSPQHSALCPAPSPQHSVLSTNCPSVILWGTGTPRREFLHVDDLADACFFLMKGYSDSQIVNIGCGQDMTVAELAAIVAKIVFSECPIVWDKTKPDGTPHKFLDVGRLSALGWKARSGIEEGIRSVYDGYRALRG